MKGDQVAPLASLPFGLGITLPFAPRSTHALASGLTTPGARQRNVTSKTPCSAFEPIFVELLKTRSCLESCTHCWRAADIAASLAGPVPPLDVRDDSL